MAMSVLIVLVGNAQLERNANLFILNRNMCEEKIVKLYVSEIYIRDKIRDICRKTAYLMVETRFRKGAADPSDIIIVSLDITTLSSVSMPPFNPSTSALLVIDMQNDFCPPVSPLVSGLIP